VYFSSLVFKFDVIFVKLFDFCDFSDSQILYRSYRFLLLIQMASAMLSVASACPSASLSAHENLKVLLVFISVISLSITFCVILKRRFLFVYRENAGK
jgi:hypothetical protein